MTIRKRKKCRKYGIKFLKKFLKKVENQIQNKCFKNEVFKGQKTRKIKTSAFRQEVLFIDIL